MSQIFSHTHCCAAWIWFLICMWLICTNLHILQIGPCNICSVIRWGLCPGRIGSSAICWKICSTWGSRVWQQSLFQDQGCVMLDCTFSRSQGHMPKGGKWPMSRKYYHSFWLGYGSQCGRPMTQQFDHTRVGPTQCFFDGETCWKRVSDM